MSDSNGKWWLLILVLGLGGIWQISRTERSAPAPGGATTSRDWDAVAAADRDLEPYSEPPQPGRPPHARDPRHAPAVAHPFPKPAEVTPDQLAKFIQSTKAGEVVDSAKKKKDDDKCTPKIDPRTGKTIPCKPKKKKKKDAKDDAKTAVAPKATTTAPTAPATPAASSDIITGVGSAIKTGQLDVNPNATAAAAGGTTYDGQDEWEAKLLKTPSLANTKLFIVAFQKNQVSSTIFYAITQKMLNDSREDMKLLGVMCAGVNQSAPGFTMLANFAGSAAAGTDSATQAAAALAKYATVPTLPILASVMRTNASPGPTVTAMQKLDETAKATIGAGGTAPTGSTATPVGSTPARGAPFAKFVPILQALTKGTNTTITQQATTTLADLQALLGTVAPPASTTPPTSGAGGSTVAPQSRPGGGFGGPSRR